MFASDVLGRRGSAGGRAAGVAVSGTSSDKDSVTIEILPKSSKDRIGYCFFPVPKNCWAKMGVAIMGGFKRFFVTPKSSEKLKTERTRVKGEILKKQYPPRHCFHRALVCRIGTLVGYPLLDAPSGVGMGDRN